MTTKHMTADEFLRGATLPDGDGIYWREADGTDYHIVLDDAGELVRNYGLRGTAAGSITVDGEGNGHALRDGKGKGHALRDGEGNGDARRYGEGKGDALRDGKGEGDALRDGKGEGDARRDGKGEGDAWNRIAYSAPYPLLTDGHGHYRAGCRGPWTRKQALEHWGARTDSRAQLFTAAIRKP